MGVAQNIQSADPMFSRVATKCDRGVNCAILDHWTILYSYWYMLTGRHKTYTDAGLKRELRHLIKSFEEFGRQLLVTLPLIQLQLAISVDQR